MIVSVWLLGRRRVSFPTRVQGERTTRLREARRISRIRSFSKSAMAHVRHHCSRTADATEGENDLDGRHRNRKRSPMCRVPAPRAGSSDWTGDGTRGAYDSGPQSLLAGTGGDGGDRRAWAAEPARGSSSTGGLRIRAAVRAKFRRVTATDGTEGRMTVVGKQGHRFLLLRFREGTDEMVDSRRAALSRLSP